MNCEFFKLIVFKKLGKMFAVFVAICLFLIGNSAALNFKNGAYEDLIFHIQDDVPFENCREVLSNLEVRTFDC